MAKYGRNAHAIAALVRDAEVHRDVYVDPEIFELEMEHLFPNSWIYVGHASQLSKPGDFITANIGRQPVLASRHTDGSIHVFYNRCPHKGVKIASEPCGNTGKFFRCPYHAWSFKTDGSLLAIPLKKGYEGTGFADTQANGGLSKVKNVVIYRDFIFARLNDNGVSFEDYFGESLSTIDNMVDRSPEGKLAVQATPIRYMHTCNWKMLVENQTDTCHPMVAHESSAGTAVKVWKREQGDSTETPMAVQLYGPFMSPYEFYEQSGIRIWPNGHGHTGVANSIHSNYSDVDRLSRPDGRGLRRDAGARDPRRGPAQHRLLPEHHGQRRRPDPAQLHPDRGRQDAGRELGLSPGRRARQALRARADV